MPTERPCTGQVFWRRLTREIDEAAAFGSTTIRVDDVAVLNMENEKFTKTVGVLMFFLENG
jgi:hypothetical protein